MRVLIQNKKKVKKNYRVQRLFCVRKYGRLVEAGTGIHY
jgi:hypothetical protein